MISSSDDIQGVSCPERRDPGRKGRPRSSWTQATRTASPWLVHTTQPLIHSPPCLPTTVGEPWPPPTAVLEWVPGSASSVTRRLARRALANASGPVELGFPPGRIWSLSARERVSR